MPTPEKKTDSWTQENLACRNTFVLLVGLKQLTDTFANAGKKPMKGLAFWNPAASDVTRQLIATGLAAQFDKFYIKVLLASYEDGYDFHGAVEAMKNVMMAADKTVCDLAAEIDCIYHFRGE